jgi:hypothetical protein
MLSVFALRQIPLRIIKTALLTNKFCIYRYIKELADRVTTLERERKALGHDSTSPQPSGPGLNQDDMTFLSGVEGGPYSPAPTGAGSGQKRTHSMSEGGFNDHYSGAGRGGFPPQEQLYINDDGINS